MADINYIDIGAVKMEYSLTGPAGKPVIAFAHGFSMNLKQFLKQQSYFSDKYRVLLFSMRGHGGSGCPELAGRESFTLEVMAADVVTLFDHLGLSAVHWVGNSMGGLLGYQVLRDAPETLQSLATFGITASQHYGPLLEKVAGLSMNLVSSLNLIPVLGKLGGFMVSKESETQRKAIEMAQEASKPALKYGHFNVYSFDYLDELAEANIPILLIRCEYDRAMNRVLGSTLRVLQNSEKGTVIEMPGVGHFANLDDPAHFNRILENWYQRTIGQRDDHIQY